MSFKHRNSDLEYRIQYYMASTVAQGYHTKRTRCPQTRLTDISRQLGLRLPKNTTLSCIDVFKLLYLKWLELGMDEWYPNPMWKWTIYNDLKDKQ